MFKRGGEFIKRAGLATETEKGGILESAPSSLYLLFAFLAFSVEEAQLLRLAIVLVVTDPAF